MPEILLLVFIVLFIGFKSPEHAGDRVIDGDGKGYYTWLPAIFIYHDLQFGFSEQIEAAYYPGKRTAVGGFVVETGDGKVNKFIPGMAILWLPFFLFGHLMAWLEMYPTDGYSLPYQYAIALSALVFLWLGARWLIKLLGAFGASERLAAFVTAVTVLGTNLVYYTVAEPSMTHVYSFALLTGFALSVHRLFHDFGPKWIVRTMVVFALIILVRPVNGLVILLVPFFAGSAETMQQTLRATLEEKRALFRGSIQSLLLLSVPVVLSYLQAGKPFAYTCGHETFDLLSPNIADILFSFNRGWFVYTPIALVSLAGFAGLLRRNRFALLWLAGFLLVFTYVVSCWGAWHYDSRCGQRVFVDIYAMTGLLLFFLLSSAGNRWKKILQGLLILLVALNLVQFYQHLRGVFPAITITKEIYFDVFPRLRPQARVWVPGDAIAAEKIFRHDMEEPLGKPWMNAGTLTDSVQFAGNRSSKVDSRLPYSAGLEAGTDSLFSAPGRVVQVTAQLLSPRAVPEAVMVVDFQAGGRSVSYNQFPLEKYVPAGEWTAVQAAFHVPLNLPPGASVKVYFFNPSAIWTVYVDDLSVAFLSLKEDPARREIDGIIMPETIKP